SALVDPQIGSEPEPGEEPSLSEQSFSVTLCEDLTTAQDGWVRVRVGLYALYTRRISGHVSATRLGPLATPIPETGLPWRLDPPTAADLGSPARSGMTDAQGHASFSLRGGGDYMLTFVVAGREWLVPLTVRPGHPAIDGDTTTR